MFQQNERILTISQNQTTNPTPLTTQTTTRLAKTHPPPWHSTNHSNSQIGEGEKKKKEAKVGQPPTITHKSSLYHGPQTIPATQKLNHQWTHKNPATHHNP